MSKNHRVVVVLEAKVGKEQELESELKTVAEHSRAESTNLDYQVMKDKNNPRQFILCESWESAEKHQAQFTKNYIQAFASKLETLLEKPFQAYMGEEV